MFCRFCTAHMAGNITACGLLIGSVYLLLQTGQESWVNGGVIDGSGSGEWRSRVG